MSGVKSNHPVTASKVFLRAGIFAACLLVLSLVIPFPAAAMAGITVAPANITLDLPKDQFLAETNIQITNSYNQPITLSLSIEALQNASGADRKALTSIRIDSNNVTIGAGETVSKTLSLQDSEQLAPGSAQAELVISQPVTSTNIGIAPQLRLPINVIKRDGATTVISLQEVKLPIFALSLPKNAEVNFKNDGNTLAIPHGTVKLTGPNGKSVGAGVINSGSVAVAAGKNLDFKTKLTKFGNGNWPGIYTANISYGLGGDNPRKTASVSFLYVAWWQVLILAALCMGAFLLAKKIFKPKKFVSVKYSPKRRAGIKRLVP